MSQSDPIADMLTRIRNANSARKKEVLIPYSKMKGEIARILKNEGYITDYAVETVEGKPRLNITMKYTGKDSVIQNLRRISRPGVRRYVGSEEIPRVLGGLGISILSTSRGIMSGRDARKQKVGGELLACVY